MKKWNEAFLPMLPIINFFVQIFSDFHIFLGKLTTGRVYVRKFFSLRNLLKDGIGFLNSVANKIFLLISATKRRKLVEFFDERGLG